MSKLNVSTLLAAAGLAASSAWAAQPWLPVRAHDCDRACAVDRLETAMFDLLPADQRIAIARGMAERGDADDAYERVSGIISRETFDTMRPEWKTAMEKLHADGNPGIAACFAPGTDPAVAAAFNELLYGAGARYQLGDRWNSTAFSGGGLGLGDPTTISYSFVPDGTTVADAGFGSGGSQLFNWMNGIYGNQSTWQDLFHSVFDRWEELSGNTYIFEPNDDGATHSSSFNEGVQGVRGDVRIAALSLDGGGGVLAYNFFPDNGDMVLDAFDSFYNNTGSNSIRLRNIISHEHGHGKGAEHVCPADGSKLMEPFINPGFDGPQLDDILLAQRAYGDPQEDNDSVGQATDLGATTLVGLPRLSIDDNSDVDWFSVDITEASELNVSATPTGETYQQGPQTSQCNSGATFDSLRIHDLRLDIIASDGSTVLAAADDGGLGDQEAASAVIEDPGTYYIRVRGDTTNNIQAYSLSVTVEDLPFIPADIDLAGPAPTELDPGVTTPVSVTIEANDEAIVPGSPALRFRDDGGTFQTITLSDAGGGLFTADIPASSCGADPEFFFELEADLSGTVTLPADGASDPFTAIVGELDVVFEDDFESDTGWSVSGDITSGGAGRWQRGVPAGAGDDRVSDPDSDFDGSGQCYVTGNQSGNADVDDGTTILTSPAFDVANNAEATISYARWFDNNEGGDASNPFTETLLVEITNDGSDWVELEEVGPFGNEVSGGWFVKEFRIADFVIPTDSVRVRFIASDDVGTIVEAGVDAVSVSGLLCEDPAGGCNPADIAEPFGILDLTDVNAFVAAFAASEPAADIAEPFGVYDLSDVNAFIQAFGQGCP